MNKAFYFVFFLLISEILFSQTGTPFIKNFSPEDFQNETQIWDAVQDNSGIMFFGCNTGILEYDGQTWQKISVPNHSPVRSLCINTQGIIYVGSVGEFGYLKLTNTEGYKYISLSDKTVGLNSHFTDVWTVETAGKNVYFATAEFLFRYNPDKIPSVKKISTANPPFLLYKLKQEVYVSIRGKGTGKLFGDSIIPLKGMEKVHPWFMISYNKSCDIIGNLDGLTVYCPAAESSDKVISPDTLFNKKDIEATNNFLRKNQLYTGAVALGNNRFAVGTLSNGVIIINQYGKIINIINESKGLQNNTIHALYKDSQNELWACTADGISKIDINSPYELFGKNDGIKGSIYDVLRFYDKFYVTTNLGLYYYTNSGFEGVKGLSGKDAIQILSFFIFKTDTDSVFFVNTIYGMYRINKERPTKINALNYSSFIQSEFKKNTVYYTKDYSLYKMTFRNNTLINPEKIYAFKNLANIGCEINKDNLILIINEKPVIYNLITHNVSEIKIDIKVSDIEKAGKTIFAYTEKGLYIYNSEKNTFIKDKKYTVDLPENIKILQFDKSSENNYWLSAKYNSKFFLAHIFKKDKKYTAELSPYKRLSNTEYFYADGDSLLWAVNNKIIYKYNIQNHKNFKQQEQCLIRIVKLKNDSIIFSGVYSSDSKNNSTQKFIIDYNFNDINFQYTLTSYDGDKNEFSYKLENGKVKPWSDLSKTNFKEYTNLPEGEYTFSVKGYNIYGIESKPVQFKFEILPPWYRTITAYIIYLLLLIFFIRGFVKLHAKRLEKENIRLDNIVKTRTAEVLTQKEEIQTQADYLEEINNELNQKNEEISTIADNLKEANVKIKEKNKYITDSINYAQKIQSAVLPSDTEIKKLLTDFFIIYKPRDIVSGDFYYIKKRGNYIILAVADCTGHGVPGGFLAMMGIAVLSDVVQDTQITNPAAALEKMRNIIKKSLHQNTYLESRNEGIEIALCAINTKDLSLEYAGANHPLFIVRQKGEDAEIIEIAADLQPVGIHYKEKPFSLKQFQLQEGDMIYMFSDGYFDQFGGSDKKKFLLKNLKDLLTEISKDSMKIQKRKILNAFNSWKGKNKQVDDVLLLGIRVKNFYSE